MLNYSITFLSPWYLALAAIVPALWWFSYWRLSGLGPLRRTVALVLRSLVVLLLLAALAEIQIVRSSDRVTVIYLLDQSLSIPDNRRREMVDYVNAAVAQHRRNDDRAGAIVFGRDAAIEIPPIDYAVPVAWPVESLLDPDYTNLAAAMKLALAAFPEDAARRIVLLSDGNQNLGDAAEQARALASAGVGIDVMPVRYAHQAEVAVERLLLPNDIRRGEPFDLKAVVTCITDPEKPGVVSHGRLEFRRQQDGQWVVLNRDQDQHVTLEPGKHVFTLRQQIDTPDFYTYEARFLPDSPQDDTMPQNNRATAFTHIRGKGQVLLVVNEEDPGQYGRLADALRRQNLEVVVRHGGEAFSNLGELQPFDTVVLADVPRDQFSDAQIKALVRNTQQMGAGLVMIGGQNSFGAGGWTNSELEEAMPVDFQVKNIKVIPRGALVMLMHASEMADGNYWQKQIATEAIRQLGPRDLCGVLHWSGTGRWLWNPGLSEVGQSRDRMLGCVDRMVPGDMPDFTPTMIMAQQEFAKLDDVPVKHMVVISDGDPAVPSSALIGALKALKVTVSTVTIAAHGPAQSQAMADIARATGGKNYTVNNPKSLPRIYQREARRIAQPLVYESKQGFRPQIHYPHEMLRGISGPLPPIHGFVLTNKKENALVETSLISPQPAAPESNTILASWTYGLGKAVAFTSDATNRWTAPWADWDNYDKLFSQIVRWSMRPAAEAGKFAVATETSEGQVRVIISALDKNDQFLNFLNMAGMVVGPDLKASELKVEQTAPGRYVGTFSTREPGSYFLTLSPGPGQAPLRSGVNVPYSDEFRDRTTNEPLLVQLAATKPEGGPSGELLPALDDATTLATRLSVNSFRHDLPKASSRQNAWHTMLLLAAWALFADIFVRRVHVGFGWVPPLVQATMGRLLHRAAAPAPAEHLERLRSRKAEVREHIEQFRATARFEAPPTPAGTAEPLEPLTPPPPAAGPTPQMTPEQKAEEDSYTARLLRAKKEAWEKKKKGE